MTSTKTQIEAKMTEIKSSKAQERLQTKIKLKIELQKSLKTPIRGRGSTILLRLAEGLNQSGDPYKDGDTPTKAASVLLGELDRYLGNGVLSGEHNLIYRSDNSLLISIDGQYYEITGNDLKNSVLKFAQNAGVPFNLIGTALAKELIEGIVEVWKKHDPNYKIGSRLVR